MARSKEQVDLLISFCLSMGFLSVVFVGHDDGGLLALKAVEKLRAAAEPVLVEVKGVVLLSVSLSREVVPAFARILLHTSLGKKHMVRPLLRTEITQIINRRAWYDPTKLTSEILSLYKEAMVQSFNTGEHCICDGIMEGLTVDSGTPKIDEIWTLPKTVLRSIPMNVSFFWSQIGHFKGMPFHRVIKHHVMQGGDIQELGAAEDWMREGKSHKLDTRYKVG